MKVHFWGTRGSLSASYTHEDIRKKIFSALKASNGLNLHTDKEIETFLYKGIANKTLPFSVSGSYGSNTSCVEIISGKEYIICDAGTGLRDFGNHVMQSMKHGAQDNSKVFHIFMSHLHWDHMQGFPFFTPAYVGGNNVHIYGFHKDLERAFIFQQEYPFFPIPFKSLSANIQFTILEEGREYEIAGLTVRGKKQKHPGDSYGYRFEKNGKSIVYSTDSEHKLDDYGEENAFINFFKDTDLLIFDAQYSLFDAISSKENWGHSNNIIAVELSVKSGVKHLCVYHNEPACDDARLEEFLDDTRRYLRIFAETSSLIVDIAYDGMEVDV